MKILFVVWNMIDTCSLYRSGGIAPDLRKKLKIDIEVVPFDNEFHWANLIDYDLIMLQRPLTQMALQMSFYAKNLGIPIWVDYDDLLIDVPWESKLYERYNDQVKQTIKNIIRMADAVSVTTPLLKQELAPYSDNIHVIPNAFNDHIFRVRELPPKRQKIIAWRGGDTHDADLMAIREPITRAFEEYPDWVFSFMGLRPRFFDEYPNVKYYPVTDPMMYFANIQSSAPVLFHIPLKDNKFNRGKSNIAYIEAAQFGSVCLVPYWEEWKLPGVIHYGDFEHSYYQAISTTITEVLADGNSIRNKASMAWEYVNDNLRLSKINELRAELVKSLL